MSDDADITVTDIILPRDYFVRMERQLVAAERLYEATHRYLHGYGSVDAALDALADYANTKGER